MGVRAQPKPGDVQIARALAGRSLLHRGGPAHQAPVRSRVSTAQERSAAPASAPGSPTHRAGWTGATALRVPRHPLVPGPFSHAGADIVGRVIAYLPVVEWEGRL